MARTKKQTEEIDVLQVVRGEVSFCVLGATPLIMNCMSNKVKHQLLLPQSKSRARGPDRTGLKHDPLVEYFDSAYKSLHEDGPTRLLLLSTAFKAAMASAATDIPGAAKAQIGRLTYVKGDYISIYGVPEMLMSVVRSADIKKTPDVRTRAILPAWACQVSINYVKPILREQVVANLFAAAGIMQGVGDFRVEKGKGNYGQFTLVAEDDAQFRKIIKSGGLAAQDAALRSPKPYDSETAELYKWWKDEAKRLGFKLGTVK